MKPSTKIIGFTILGAVIGALLGFFYRYLFTRDFISALFSVSPPFMITGALIFLEISSVNELTKRKSKLIRCLSLIFAIALAYVIIRKVLPPLWGYFEKIYFQYFVEPKLH